MKDKALTITEVAYMIGRTEKTVRTWIETRDFPTQIEGGRLWSENAVEAWCRANGVRTVTVQR